MKDIRLSIFRPSHQSKCHITYITATVRNTSAPAEKRWPDHPGPEYDRMTPANTVKTYQLQYGSPPSGAPLTLQGYSSFVNMQRKRSNHQPTKSHKLFQIGYLSHWNIPTPAKNFFLYDNALKHKKFLRCREIDKKSYYKQNIESSLIDIYLWKWVKSWHEWKILRHFLEKTT